MTTPKKKHPRYSRPTKTSKLFSMAVHLLSLPQVPTDAFVVLPGEGEDWRVRHGVQSMNSGKYRKLLLAPFNTTEKTTRKLAIEDLMGKAYGLRSPVGVIIGGHAEHTAEQAEWLYWQIVDNDITSLTVGASPYHDERGPFTVLKHLLKQRCKMVMIAAPTPVPPSRVVPESNMDSWTLIHGEVKRIGIYQKTGDVVTFPEFQAYIDWLWEQEPFKSLAC